MENKEIARVLWETADLMEIAAEDGFRIRSYRNGATAVEGYPERIADILADPARKVTDIPGIGKGLAVVLHEIVDHGSCERRDLLLQKFPPTTIEFLKIQGLGPKSIALILEHYRISTMDELERLAKEEKLRVLPRMGAKLEEKVLRSIAQYRMRSGRYLLSYAEAMAEELAGILRGPGVDRITPAGSLRRGRETVGDLDLLVTGPDATPALDRFIAYSRVEEVLGRGENKASAKVGREGLQVDVRALPPASFGAALQYFTGSKDHNVSLRTRAVRMGLKLSEYGLFRSDGPGFRRSCAKTRAKSKPPRKAACLNWSISQISAATCTCTPSRPMAAPRSRKWLPRRATAVTSTSPSPTIPKRWPWPTVWTKNAWSSSRGRCARSTATASASASSPASNATSCAMARWTWPTTRWLSSTW